jgi:hypothetical protein
MCLDSPSVPSASDTAAATLQAQVQYAPQVYQSNAQFSPLYTNLALSNLNSFLNGSPSTTVSAPTKMTAGTTGWYDPSGNFVSSGTYQPGTTTGTGDRRGAEAQPAGFVPGTSPGTGDMWETAGNQFTANKTTTTPATTGYLSLYANNILPTLVNASTMANTATRTANVNDALNLAPAIAGVSRASNPQGASLLDSMAGTAGNELSFGTQLTPAEKVQLDQSVRGASAARGMGTGPSDVFNESLAETGLGQQLLQQRMGNASMALNNLNSFYPNALAAVGGMNSPVAANTNSVIGTATGSAAPAMSSEFDPTGAFAQQIQNQGWEANQANSMNENHWVGMADSAAQSAMSY